MVAETGVNAKLLQALPDARRVLEIGQPDPRLSKAYLEGHPQAQWTRLETDPRAGGVEGEYDLIVSNDTLGRFAGPAQALLALEPHLAPEARLVWAVANGAHAQVAAQLVMGDMTYQPGALLDPSRPHLFSQASAFKVLLDGGWLPALADAHSAPLLDDPVTRLLLETAQRLGAPLNTAGRNLSITQYIISGKRWPARQTPAPAAKVSVVVAVNRPLQYHLNIEASPGLKAIGAELVPITGAASAADALEQGRARAGGEWLIFCHQDVYFSEIAAWAISDALAQSQSPDMRDRLIGFAGLECDAAGASRQAGLVVDRISLFDQPASEDAITMDELAVVLHRDSPHRIDPGMGWHLWATDLVLSGWARPQRLPARIIRAPVFHNSLSDWSLPKVFEESARYLRAKHPRAGRIDTLCVSIP
jgi:hypothetical protein